MRYIFIILLVLLTGCQSKVIVPKVLPTADIVCSYAEPPAPDVWYGLTDADRVLTLSKLYIRQLQYTRDCQDTVNYILNLR
jgi:hypothetical protein